VRPSGPAEGAAVVAMARRGTRMSALRIMMVMVIVLVGWVSGARICGVGVFGLCAEAVLDQCLRWVFSTYCLEKYGEAGVKWMERQELKRETVGDG
jgi:hypothetical protein